MGRVYRTTGTDEYPHCVSRRRGCQHGHLLERVGRRCSYEEQRRAQERHDLQRIPGGEQERGAESPFLGIPVEFPSVLAGPHDTRHLPEGILQHPSSSRSQSCIEIELDIGRL